MRELYLHVGPQKTGSTYLHRLLVVNADALAAADLGFAPYYDPAVGDHQGRFIPALEAKGMAAVMAETAARPEPRLLVTDEDLAKFLTEPAGGASQAHALAAAARAHFRPHIVYFARRQDHLAESHFAQGAKTWYCGRPADYPEQDYDHDATLRAIDRAIRNRPIPFSYERGPHDRKRARSGPKQYDVHQRARWSGKQGQHRQCHDLHDQ